MKNTKNFEGKGAHLYAKLSKALHHAIQPCGGRHDLHLKEAYDWDHTRAVMLKLQAALQECEDIYVDAE